MLHEQLASLAGFPLKMRVAEVGILVDHAPLAGVRVDHLHAETLRVVAQVDAVADIAPVGRDGRMVDDGVGAFDREHVLRLAGGQIHARERDAVLAAIRDVEVVVV